MEQSGPSSEGQRAMSCLFIKQRLVHLRLTWASDEKAASFKMQGVSLGLAGASLTANSTSAAQPQHRGLEGLLLSRKPDICCDESSGHQKAPRLSLSLISIVLGQPLTFCLSIRLVLNFSLLGPSPDNGEGPPSPRSGEGPDGLSTVASAVVSGLISKWAQHSPASSPTYCLLMSPKVWSPRQVPALGYCLSPQPSFFPPFTSALFFLQAWVSKISVCLT